MAIAPPTSRRPSGVYGNYEAGTSSLPSALQYSVRGLEDLDLQLLAKSLDGLTAEVLTINLGYNRITDRGAVALARILHPACSLQKLQLHENQIGARGSFCTARSHPAPHALPTATDGCEASPAWPHARAASVGSQGTRVLQPWQTRCAPAVRRRLPSSGSRSIR